MYRTKNDEHKRWYCPSGSQFENVYEEEINKKTGQKHLVKVGETNIYERIQADFEETKIENILHKLAMGDLSVLKEAQLTYVDADDFPKTLMDAQNIVVKAKAEFNKFPEEVKKLFNNSPEAYVSEMGTDEFVNKMAPYNDEIKKRQKEEADKIYQQKIKETADFNKAVNAAMGGDNA